MKINKGNQMNNETTDQESENKLLASYYNMLKESAPDLEMIKISISYLNDEETQQLHGAYNGPCHEKDENGVITEEGVSLFYDDLQSWEQERDDYGDYTNGITQKDIANCEKVIAQRKPILESLLCQKAELISWANLDWLLRNNYHVRESVGSMLEERFERLEKKNDPTPISTHSKEVKNLADALSTEDYTAILENLDAHEEQQTSMQSAFEMVKFDRDLDGLSFLEEASNECVETQEEVKNTLKKYEEYSSLVDDLEPWDFDLHEEIREVLELRKSKTKEAA
ncbi:hypothetical protein N9147_05130 [Akkermansiaceae bacterium]|nr:hypothetical protein [Akkermansiaceae bacterium]